MSLLPTRAPRPYANPYVAGVGLGLVLVAAFVIMGRGLGAVLARGCTSGQALTGGALLSVGSWIFVLGAFAAAYTVAPLVRRVWT